MADLVAPLRVQRAVVFLAAWLSAAAVIMWVPLFEADAANTQSNAYQPLQCAANGTTGQGRRETVNLSNDSVNGNIANTNAYPCLAGVPWKFEVGLNNTASNSTTVPTGDPWVLAVVEGMYAKNPDNNFFFGATGDSGLFQIAFKSLQLCTDASAPVAGCDIGVSNIDSGTNTNRNDVALFASSAGTVDPKPLKPYVFRLAPDGPVSIGGPNIITDVLAEGSSTFSAGPENITLGGTGCGIAGGTKYPTGIFDTMHTCQGITLSSAAGLAWILGVQTFYIKQLNLNFQYIITHGGSTTDPYTDPPGGAATPLTSMQLPNTRITVCQSATACNPSLTYPHDD